VDEPIVPTTGRVPYGFLVVGSLVVGLQLLVPDGAARSVVSFVVYVAITGAVVAGVLVHSPRRPAPWVLLAVAMALFAVDMFGWVLVTIEWAVDFGEFLQDATRLLAVLAIAGAIAVFLRMQSRGSSRTIISDGLLIAAGAALMLWQWFVLVQGMGETEVLGRVVVPLVLTGLAVTMTVAASRILGVTLIGSQSMLLLLGAAATALAAQAALTLTDSGAGPARWTDATWLIAGVLVGAAALHPTMAQPVVRLQPQSQQATRMLLVGTVLLVNPAIVWLHLLQPASDRRVVWVVAAGVAIVTVFGVWRVGKLVADLGNMRVAVARSEARFRSLVQHASDLITVIDRAGVVSYASPSAGKVLGRSPNELVGTPLVDLASAADSARFADFLAAAAQNHSPPLSSEIVMRHHSGEELNTAIVSVNLEDEPGVDGIVVTIRDVTERAKFEAELKHLATHDTLTGLANRALFRDRVSHALERSARQLTSVGVVFVDLDDFKAVNDSLGHLAGDEVLRTVADRLRESLRTVDTAARLGGDEFAILLEDLGEPADAIPIVERMGAAVKRQMMIEGRRVQLGASMGVAFGRVAGSTEDLLRNADIAMLKAKSSGKSRYNVFEPEMRTPAMSRGELKADR
jgi:diguanylate cyclase (GGDEF)-like protein/PAS domain S-box-containing protein